ncbi:MAG: SDR family NAD(P)-dependent oxidoreductase [Anaerolineaceae bacterium]|nr:MAG: SDR family NAD(P)-dependent oxidoreductase [Anaerolineaceae bacterium]
MACYLLPGAAGFIGARVTEFLLGDGHQVIGVDNLNDAYDVRLKEWRLGCLEGHPEFVFHKMDITDKEALNRLVEQAGAIDAVINMAARAGVRQSVANPREYVDTNIVGTLNLLELCRHHGISKFILASTSSIYGADAPLPTPEGADSSLPLQPYAATKKAAEAMCHAYHYLFDIDVTILRYFTVYGPAGRPDMVVFRFVQRIYEDQTVIVYGDGEQSRGMTYVDDIARGTILGLQNMGYEIINLGGHEVIKINDLLKNLETLMGKKAEVEYQALHPADMLANWAQVEKAGQLLGWEPRVSLEEGLKATIDWYRSEREWACQVETSP